MSVSVAHITFDCADPAKVAGFWSQLIGRPVDEGASEFFATVGLSGEGEGTAMRPALMFIKVPEPKSVKNRVHIDLTAPDWDAEIERAVSLGATRVADFDEYGTKWATLLDPEGNEFDIGAGM
jgi:predicted enzyme related to lactoylglutathione lyase